MKIKICGLDITRDVQLCIDHKVNFLGFVFYKKSPRNVNIKDINILSKYNKKNSSFVAVTVNPTDSFIKENFTKPLSKASKQIEDLKEDSSKAVLKILQKNHRKETT